MIGAGDTSCVEKCRFGDDFTLEVWIRWRRFLLGLQQDSNSKHARVLLSQNFPLSYLKIKGKGRKGTILAIIIVKKERI